MVASDTCAALATTYTAVGFNVSSASFVDSSTPPLPLVSNTGTPRPLAIAPTVVAATASPGWTRNTEPCADDGNEPGKPCIATVAAVSAPSLPAKRTTFGTSFLTWVSTLSD